MLGIFQSKSGDPERKKLLDRYIKIIDTDTLTADKLIEAEQIRSALGFRVTVEQDIMRLRNVKRTVAKWKELPKALKEAEQAQNNYVETANRVKAEIERLNAELDTARRDMKQPTQHARTLALDFRRPLMGGAAASEAVIAYEQNARTKAKIPRRTEDTPEPPTDADELIKQAERLVKINGEYVPSRELYGSEDFAGNGRTMLIRN